MEKVEALKKIEKLHPTENNIYVAVCPKTLYCEMCKKYHPYNEVNYIPVANMNACIPCTTLITRLLNSTEEEA